MLGSVTVEQDEGSRARSRDRRADAWNARTALWVDSQLDRVRSCGHHSVRDSGAVTIRSTGGSAGFAGLASCGSVWACPMCARRIATARQLEIQHAVDTWTVKHGGAVAMATFTVSHRLGQRLSTVWDAVQSGWHAVSTGRAGLANAAAFGIEYWLRVVEVTVGDNGWHVHTHVVYFLTEPLCAEQLGQLERALYGRWLAGIGKHGFSATSKRGCDLKMMSGAKVGTSIGAYFGKTVYTGRRETAESVGYEVARGDLKAAKAGSETPFQLLQRYVEQGEVEALDTWHEWERGSKGRKQMHWSRGCREFFRLTADRTDEEIAAEELGTAADDVVVVSRETWLAARHIGWHLLQLVEDGGVPALCDWLTENGQTWWLPGDGPPSAIRRAPAARTWLRSGRGSRRRP